MKHLPEERTRRLDKAIRLGYSYGLTYPFIDDPLDAKILSDREEKQYSDLIRTTLITGSVPQLGVWTGINVDLINIFIRNSAMPLSILRTISNERQEIIF